MFCIICFDVQIRVRAQVQLKSNGSAATIHTRAYCCGRERLVFLVAACGGDWFICCMAALPACPFKSCCQTQGGMRTQFRALNFFELCSYHNINHVDISLRELNHLSLQVGLVGNNFCCCKRIYHRRAGGEGNNSENREDCHAEKGDGNDSAIEARSALIRFAYCAIIRRHDS